MCRFFLCSNFIRHVVHQSFAAVDGKDHGAATCIGNNGTTIDLWFLEHFKLQWQWPVTFGEFGLTVNELWPVEGNATLDLCRLSGRYRGRVPVNRTWGHLVLLRGSLTFFNWPCLTQSSFFSLPVGLAGMEQYLYKDALVCWRVGHPLIHSIVKHQVKFWCVLKKQTITMERLVVL